VRHPGVTVFVAVLVLGVTGIGTAHAADTSVRASNAALSVVLSGPNTSSLGSVLSYTATAEGGTPPYQWEWLLNATPTTANVSASNGTGTFAFRPLGDSIYVVTVILNDSLGAQRSQQATCAVTGADPVSVSVSVLSVGANDSVRVGAKVSGGAAPFEFRWTGPGAPAGWSTEANFTTTPLGTGTYPVSAIVRDAHGYRAGGAVTIRFHATNESNPGLPWYFFVSAGALAGAILLLAVLVVWRRRRRAPPPSPAP
jgi:hypothetical protein